VAFVRTDISEEYTVSIIRMERISDLETTLALTSNFLCSVLQLLVTCLPILSAPMMQAIRSVFMSVLRQHSTNGYLIAVLTFRKPTHIGEFKSVRWDERRHITRPPHSDVLSLRMRFLHEFSNKTVKNECSNWGGIQSSLNLLRSYT
jgi:hypothetical protein